MCVSRSQQIVLSTSLIFLQTDFHRGATASTNQQTALRRKKKKSKRLDTSTSGIFVRRGVSSPRTIHCLDKDWSWSEQDCGWLQQIIYVYLGGYRKQFYWMCTSDQYQKGCGFQSKPVVSKPVFSNQPRRLFPRLLILWFLIFITLLDVQCI